MPKCCVCSHWFEANSIRAAVVSCPNCGKLQDLSGNVLTGVPGSLQGSVPREVARALPQKFLVAKAQAKCERCLATFEHEKAPTDPLFCAKCGSNRVRRLLGRIYAVPEGVEEALHPRVKKWLRVLKANNEQVMEFDRSAGAMLTTLRRAGVQPPTVEEWERKIESLREEVVRVRNVKLDEFEKYLAAFSEPVLSR